MRIIMPGPKYDGNYRNGFDAMLAERDRLRLYSMATVEHYFKQQKVQLVKYNYNVIRDKVRSYIGRITHS